LFFKWIKQHLRIKRFFGTSENAVKTQIWIAVSVYVPDGHPNSPTFGHFKIPHPDEHVTVQ
jgi:hypothetical protein